MIAEITSAEQLAAYDSAVVCFTNPLTCAPCKMLEPHYKNVAGVLGDEVPFLEVNILDHMDLAVDYGVMGTPTIVFIDGEDRSTVAARTTIPLIDEIKSLLSASSR